MPPKVKQEPGLEANGRSFGSGNEQDGTYQPGVTPKFYSDEVNKLQGQDVKPSTSSFQVEGTEERKKLKRGSSSSRTRASLVKKERKRPRRTFFGIAIRLFILYTLYAYFFVCPTDTSRGKSFCRGLDSFEKGVYQLRDTLEPHARPHLHTARQKLDPYYQKVRPYYEKADSIARPAIKNAHANYNKHLHPRVLKGWNEVQTRSKPYIDIANRKFDTQVRPHVHRYQKVGQDWYNANASPHIEAASKHGQLYYKHATGVLNPLFMKSAGAWRKGQQSWEATHPVVLQYYNEYAYPYSIQAYRKSRDTYVEHVHPRLLKGAEKAVVFARTRVIPLLRRNLSVYVSPQIEKIRDKVFEYQARQASSKAIVEAEGETKRVRTENDLEDLDGFIADLRADKEKSDDPTLPKAEKKLTDAEIAKKIAEKRAGLVALRESYVTEINKLAKREREVLADRLYEIRKGALHDIPIRLRPRLDDFDAEAEKLIQKLEKYLEKSSRDEKTSLKDRLTDAKDIADKAIGRLEDKAESMEREIQSYGSQHFEKENNALRISKDEVQRLSDKAEGDVGHGFTWLEDVTHADWLKYHQLRKASADHLDDLQGLVDGRLTEPRLAKQANVYSSLDNVRGELNKKLEKSIGHLESSVIRGMRILKGEALGVSDQISKAASGAYEGAASVVGEASQYIVSAAGATPSPTNLQQSASSIYQAARESAASAYSDASKAVGENAGYVQNVVNEQYAKVAGTPEPSNLALSASSVYESLASEAGNAYEKVASVAGDASKTIVSAVGGTPSPTNAQESAQSLYAAGRDGASSIYEQVASKVGENVGDAQKVVADQYEQAAKAGGDASKTIVQAIGGTPSPTNVVESASSLYNQVSSAVKQQAGEVYDSASSFAGQASQSVVSAVGGQPSPTNLQQSAESLYNAASGSAASAYESVAKAISDNIPYDQASSLAGAVSQSIVGAAGGTPSPTNVQQSVESAYRAATEGAASGYSSVASVAKDHADYVYSQATSAAGGVSQSIVEAVGGTPSPTDARQSVESAYQAATDGAASGFSSISSAVKENANYAYSRVASVGGDASQSIISAVGGTPSPTNVQQSVESAYRAVTDGASAGYSSATGVVRENADASLAYEKAASMVADANAAAQKAAEAAQDAIRRQIYGRDEL